MGPQAVIPEQSLSSTTIDGNFIGARARAIVSPDDYIVRDWEDGGIAFNDPSEGLMYQQWHGYIAGNEIRIGPVDGTATVIHTADNLEEMSFTFDQNMRPVIAYVADGVSYLRWYDSQAAAQVVTNFGEDMKTPRVTLDDKRATQLGVSDVILAYIRNGALYYRQQRDRFGVEYHLGDTDYYLLRIGMTDKLRLQFNLRYTL